MVIEKMTKVKNNKKGQIDLHKLASIPTFMLVSENHAKNKFAFYWDKTGRHELYIMDVASKEIKQITEGQLPRAIRAGFIWSRDDSKILFTKDRDGDEQHDVYEIDLASREVRQLTNTPKAQDYLADTSPDGEWITLSSNRDGQLNLYRMATNDGRIEQITAHENPAFGGKYSPNGEWLVYSTNEEADLKNSDIYLARPDGTHTERVLQVKVGSSDTFADWGKDSRHMLFTTDASGVAQAGVYNIETKEITMLGDNLNEEYAVALSDDLSFAISLRLEDGSVAPVVYDLKSGEVTKPHFPPGIAAGGIILEDRHLVLTLNSPTSPSQLVMYDIESDTSEVLIETEVNGVDTSLFVDGVHEYYSSADGTAIPGIVYRPRDWSPDKLYPGIVVPHGGPTGQYFMNFSMMAQYLADLNFVVLLPNVRGSTGYGKEFRDACLKKWGTLDHDDWVAGRDHLIRNYSVDPERVAVFGGSYGGYATLVCLTKSPDLWAAGCSWIPVSHLGKMYEKSMEHFKYYLRQQMGDPVKDKELWEESSPLNFVENIKAPLLLVHGTNDPRCPVSESRNVVQRLKDLGRKEGEDFEYVEYGDEGHGSFSDIKGRIRTLELLSDFLYRRMN